MSDLIIIFGKVRDVIVSTPVVPPPAHGDSLLLETGDYLLLETGDTILLE